MLLDWNYTSFDETDGYSDSPDFDFKVTNTMDWMASLRLRGGIAVERTLLYVTFGAAMASVEHDFAGQGSFVDRGTDVSEDVFGMIMGVGLERKLSDRISVRGELLQTTFAETSGQNTRPQPETFKFENKVSAFRLGVDYRF